MRRFFALYGFVVLFGVGSAAYSYYAYTQPSRDTSVLFATTTNANESTSSTPNAPLPSPEEVKTVRIGGQIVKVDIADTPALRERGLSGRHELKEGEGMLFMFPESGLHGFWMKDMRFAIDIIWLDDAGKVVHIAHAVAPESYPASFSPPAPAKFVLEVPAGFAERHSIGVGSAATLPR
jgi:uncharacterized protein